MLRSCWSVLACLLCATSAQAQVRHVDPNPATGTSAAVVVPDSAPLLHTRQLTFTSAEGQLGSVLSNLDRLLAKHGIENAELVKLNFVVARDQIVPKLEQALAAKFAGPKKPAVSFVSGSLGIDDGLVAVDAVYALPPSAAFKAVQMTSDFAVLPPGARVWISGQAEKGKDLAEATRKTMESLRASLNAVGLKDNAIVQIKSFVQPMAKHEEARREIEAFFGKQPAPPLVFVEWKSSLPIEIELIAWAGRDREGLPVEYLTPPGMTASPVYSRVARVNYGKLIYISGLHAAAGDTPAEQIIDVFDTLGGILKKVGSDYRHLVKATYYCTTAETVKKMGELRPKYYDPKRPPAASLAMTAGTGRPGKTMTLDMIAAPAATANINEYGPPEYGHGLKEKDALDGWISLFDGKTTFGWIDGKINKGLLVGGKTTTQFPHDWEMKIDVVRTGSMQLGPANTTFERTGTTYLESKAGTPLSVELLNGIAIRSLVYRARRLPPLFNGKDLTGWKRINRANTSPDRLAKWTVENGALHAVGGPDCVEYQERKYGDLILQVESRMNVRQANGGLFFRAIPGDFMNGYEAQLYNRCHDGDVSKPWTWATGAIDDRQNARRLVSRDGQWFVQTVIAHGPHVATWVNGYQTVDWTDTRDKHDNPRRGMRLEPGVIQLQAHDAGTDIEFRKIAARAME